MMIEAFQMDHILELFNINPIFKVKSIMWSDEINRVLSDESEKDIQELSDLILTGFEYHYTGRWGNISNNDEEKNDRSLQNLLLKKELISPLISKYSNEKYSIIMTTDQSCNSTWITFFDA